MKFLCYVLAAACFLASLNIIGAETFEDAIRSSCIFAVGIFWVSMGRTYP